MKWYKKLELRIKREFERWFEKMMGSDLPDKEVPVEGGDSNPTVITDPPSTSSPQPTDKVFDKIQWGDHNPIRAKTVDVFIDSVRTTSSKMYFSFGKFPDSWPDKTGDKKEMQALAFAVADFGDGSYFGDKYEWARSNTRERDWKNINNGYAGWGNIGLHNVVRWGFFFTSIDGMGVGDRRSNIIWDN